MASVGPLARIDVGASAGLNLLAGAFHYDYEPGGAVGPADASVRLHCRTEGAVPVPTVLPAIRGRRRPRSQPGRRP